MEYGTWEENRNSNLSYLAKAGDLTDVTIVVESTTFPAHRVVLAAHSEYFYRMFTCGMAESRNEDIKIQGVDPDVFQQVLAYIYTGRLDTIDVDVLKGVFLASNMLQMSDLEHITVTLLSKLCSLTNCLDLYFFVSTYCDGSEHPGLHRKVKRILSELLSDHWGEMICQANSATVSSRYTQLFQDGIMPTAAQLTDRGTCGVDKLQQDFLDLDLPSLCEIFRLKSMQEEVSDFSFSFGQTDVCEGLIAWMEHDREERQTYIHTLRQYVCLHQVSGSTKKKYCKLLHEITQHALLSVSEEGMQEEEEVLTYGQLDQDCLGAWCPVRRIPGFILIHAWNPNDMNTLTSDHVKCHFVRPLVDTVTGGGDREEVLKPEVLYSVREGGELSEGETHWLTQNNPVLLPTGQAMMLTLDCGVLCGQVYDGQDSTGQRCPHHSSRFPDFCMSAIRDEQVDLKAATLCSSETGHIYVVARVLDIPTPPLPPLDDHGNPIGPLDTCDTFQLVPQPEPATLQHPSCACRKGNLYLFGGTVVTEGPMFGYIWCSFDLQEFHSRYSQARARPLQVQTVRESYKAGHSTWKTRLSSIDAEPLTSSNLHIYDLTTKVWMKYPDETPFKLSGGTTVWHLEKLYLIGGFTIEYDCELKSFYQQPSPTVWIFDPSVGKWAMGAPLPKHSLVTNDKTISFRGYCFGQASSHAGYIYYSGGATLAVNNTYKPGDPGPLHKYEYVSFTKVMRLDPNTEEWSQVFMVRPDVKQDYTLYGAIPATVSLKRIKVKNGRLVSCAIAQEDGTELI